MRYVPAAVWPQNLGPVHLVVLNNYAPFAAGTDQYTFFISDLESYDRAAMPWLVVAFHASP